MNRLVRILKSEDGQPASNPRVWHLVDPVSGDGCDRTLCGGEAFGLGESGAEYEEKSAPVGGITCKECFAALLIYKKVKL